MRIHFLGIAGSGASAIANIAKAQGYEVPPRKRFIQTHAKQAILDI